MNIQRVKSLNILLAYTLFVALTGVKFVIALGSASPAIQSLTSMFMSVSVVIAIIFGVLAWLAQNGYKWAGIAFSVYCVLRIGDYVWGYIHREITPTTVSEWFYAVFIVCGWLFLLWLTVSRSSNNTLHPTKNHSFCCR